MCYKNKNILPLEVHLKHADIGVLWHHRLFVLVTFNTEIYIRNYKSWIVFSLGTFSEMFTSIMI